MREMSVEMATLLKSRKQIGDNKHTHEITIGDGGGGKITPLIKRVLRGTDGVYDPLTYSEFYDSTRTILGGDIVKRSDGKFLVNYSIGIESGGILNNGIFLSVIDDADTLFGMDNIAQDTEFLFINTKCKDEVFINRISSLLKLDNGKILLFVMNDDEINKSMDVKCYESSNGLGTDFVFKSTVYTWDYSALTTIYSKSFNVGEGIALENGRILLPIIGGEQTYSTAGTTRGYACYSDDGGATWGNSASLVDPGWASSINTFRGFGIINGNRIIAHLGYTVYGGGNYFCYSEDDGETWSSYGKQEVTTAYEVYKGVYYNNGYTYYTVNFSGERMYHIYRIPSTQVIADVDIYSQSIWGEPLFDTLFGDDNNEYLSFVGNEYITLAGVSQYAGGDMSHMFGFEVASNTLQAKSITINRNKGMAGGLTLELDNKAGILAPDGTTNPQLLWPNKEIVVKQGYGAELLKTFTGLIDSISMSRDSQGVASVTVSARDKMKAALDHYIRNQDFLYTLTYTNMTVEDIWKNLVGLAGLQYKTVEATGITISEKTFSWEAYSDAFSWLDEISGFETVCDEDGFLNFVRDGRPESVTTAYSFIEGVDITKLSYEINDQDLYYTVTVYGKSPEVLDEEDNIVTESTVIYYAEQLPQASYWAIPSGKVMRIDAPEADRLEKCQAIADKAIYLMQTRARMVSFSTIGIPHLQRGDFIEVVESSTTISEIYRITDITTTQVADGSYTMTLNCYYHGAPEPEVV